MSKHDPRVTLRQIEDHARLARTLCAGKALPDVLADRPTQLALERALEILGEAVKRLPAELLASYPAMPWKLVAGMRDRLSHGYDEIRHDVLWNTVQQDIPTLLATVEQMLKELDSTTER